jgi:hypothetical protein
LRSRAIPRVVKGLLVRESSMTPCAGRDGWYRQQALPSSNDVELYVFCRSLWVLNYMLHDAGGERRDASHHFLEKTYVYHWQFGRGSRRTHHSSRDVTVSLTPPSQIAHRSMLFLIFLQSHNDPNAIRRMQPCRFSSFPFFVTSSWHKNRRILLVASILVLVVSPVIQFLSLNEYNLQYRPNTASFGTNTSGTTTTTLNKTSNFSSFSSATTVESTTSTTLLQASRRVPSSASCNVTLSLGPLLYTTYPAHYKLTDFLKGKGVSLPNRNPPKDDANTQNASSAASSTSSIVCKYFYKGKDSPHHFPHTMQIMFRCWSWWYGQWWQQNSSVLSSSSTNRTNHQLLLLGNHVRQPLPSSFVFAVPSNWTLPYLTEQTPYPYNRGFFNALQDYANVSIQLMLSPITLAAATKTETTDRPSIATTTTTTSSTTTPAPINKIVRPYLHPDFPFQGESPDHFHALRDIILAGLEQRQQHQQQQRRHKRHFAAVMQNPDREGLFPRIAIVNREGPRKIFNAPEIAHEVESILSTWNRVNEDELAPPTTTTTTTLSIRIVTMEDWSFEEQIQFFSTVDVLISPHGAQLTSIPFLPNGASVLEVFPLGYEQHAFFGTLAAICGVTHAYTYLSQGDRQKEVQVGMIDLPTRIQRRSAQLCPAVTDLSHFILTMVKQWQERQRQPPQP